LLQNTDYTLNIYYSHNPVFIDFINQFTTYELPFNKIYSDSMKDLKNMSINHFLESTEDFCLNLDTNVSLNSYSFLNKVDMTTILAPLVKKYNELFSNFWGDVDENGFYKRSTDYIPIVNRTQIGTFPAKYINSCFLFSREIANSITNFYNSSTNNDYDVNFANNCRKNNIPMAVINEENYGNYHQKLYLSDYFEDHEDWKNKYFHPTFLKFLNSNNLEYTEPCKDAFLFPLFTPIFCKELIDITLKANLWSAGKNKDKRLSGGYENHPTVDVHLNQLGLHDIWNDIVKKFISKIASKLYSDITTKGTNINFVVKYTMGGQEFLRPHHDASVYTVDIALNEADKEFIGGGIHFVRQQQKLTHIPVGYSSMHPGRLTHYHEGLPITSGTRFILVSFIE
jgi:hypothetical protein